MELHRQNVPTLLWALIPYAERFGVLDEFERSAILETTRDVDLQELIRSVDTHRSEIDRWLLDSAAMATPTLEYASFTSLTLARDLAALILAEDRANNRRQA
jgi:hypothetical protein